MQATSSVPQTRGVRRSRLHRWMRWIVLLLALMIAGIGLMVWNSTRSAPTAVVTAPVRRETLALTVSGSGSVQPVQKLDVTFTTSGEVAEVLVKAGDTVRAGQPLARLDTTELELQVTQAAANLKSAEARLAAARGEGASELDIRQAQLALQSAEIQLAKISKGNATAADIRSAQANLDAARARLNALTNPSPTSLSAAETKLRQAEANLQNTRDTSSLNKTRAGLDLEKAVVALTQAQSRYSVAKQNWEFVQATGQDPINPERTDATGKSVPNKLNDAQRQQYYDSFVQAEAALRNAEVAVEQAQIAYDAARQKEVVDVAQAEQALRDAQTQYDALLNPSSSDLVQAQAAVVQAQAQLDRLTGSASSLDVTAAQIQVEQAKLALERLTSPASATEIAAAEAAVAQARAQFASAERALKAATLRAPFDGIVALVNITAGARFSGAAAAITLVNPGALYVDVNLSETDVARVAVGQPVTLSFDALPDITARGEVESIAPVASVQQSVVTYLVRVRFDPGTAPIKIGMSATCDILVEERSGVLTVPGRATQSQRGVQFVQVRSTSGGPDTTVRVETGLSSNGRTEIVRCIDTGDLCLKEGDVVVIPATTTTQGASTQNRPLPLDAGPPPRPGGGRP